MKPQTPFLSRAQFVLTRDGSAPPAERLDLRREQALDLREGAVNETERTVSLSFCSEEPYERWFGFEILDCRPEAVMLGRLNNGGALLKEHNRNQQTGVVVGGTAKMDNKRGVCTVRFSKSQLGTDELQDVKDGIRTLVSVGYIVHKMVLEKEVDGVQTFRVTEWEPYEVSIVSIPADPTVGIGKSDLEQIQTKKIERISMLRSLYPLILRDAGAGGTGGGGGGGATTAVTDPTLRNKQREDDLKVERERVKNIRAVATKLKRKAVSDFAEKAIEDGLSVDDFNREVLTKHFDATPTETHNPEIGMSPGEVKRFSLCKAILDTVNGGLEGLEKEVCEAAAKKIGREAKTKNNQGGFILPEEVNRAAWIENFQRALQGLIRAQNVTSFSAGGALVQEQYGPMIEFLRNQTVLGKLGITMIDGLVGNFLLPVQTGGATAYWVSETGALTDAQATFAQKAMTPKRLGCTIPFTTQFLAQTSISAEAFLRNEMAIVCALKKDLAGLEGTGTDGQPLGVKNTPGINSTVTFGGAAAWDDIVEFETGIAVDNADIGSMGFALSAATVGKWKTILRSATAGAVYLIDKGDLNGYGYQRTNQISGNIAFFAVWSQLLHAMWAGTEIIVDPYALKKSGQIEVTRNELCDFLARQPLAFNISTDSAAQ